MKTPTIEIIISGPQGCGKTQLLKHLHNLLGTHPFWMKRQKTPKLILATNTETFATYLIEPPAPATIPLGENVTRGGLRARVLTNDASGKLPVVAEVQISLGSLNAVIRRYEADGSSPVDKRLDLVGFNYHEIKSPEDTELEELRRWKAEALETLAELNTQEIGKEMGLTIGQAVAPKILPYIRDLKAKLEAAKQALQ